LVQRSENESTALGLRTLRDRVGVRDAFVHGALLIATFVTTTVAGVQWLNKDPFELSNFSTGLEYSCLLLLFLLAHELGHYFTAQDSGVSATLPYFIPFPSVFGLVPFGTLGAVIRLRQRVPSRKVLLGIGAAGPISGFIFSVIVLIIGFSTLPAQDYLYKIHPEYLQTQALPEGGLRFGTNLLYHFLETVVPATGSFVPPMNEIYHYPFLCVGWFGLFVTSMNLLPVGQLDGGHVAKASLGHHARTLELICLGTLVALGIIGLAPLVGLRSDLGWSGWIFWAIVLFVLTRKISQTNQPLDEGLPLTPPQLISAWSCAAIFVLSFTPTPISV
jgi:membrane-associated protease RseP (regulator of RpoE activity)